MNDDDDLTINEDGSLVDIKPGAWFVAFVSPIEHQKWHKVFHGTHKHCFALQFNGWTGNNGAPQWTLFEPWWSRLMVNALDGAQAAKFLRWAQRGDLLQVHEHIPGASNQIRVWMTCAVLCAHLLGRAYWVWTPHQLYRRLRAEDATQSFTAEEIGNLIKAFC